MKTSKTKTQHNTICVGHHYAQTNTNNLNKGQSKMDNQWNWQHRTHKTTTNKAKTQHNMCWKPLYATNTNNV